MAKTTNPSIVFKNGKWGSDGAVTNKTAKQINRLNKKLNKIEQPGRQMGMMERAFNKVHQTKQKLGPEAIKALAETKKQKWKSVSAMVAPGVAFDTIGTAIEKGIDASANNNITGDIKTGRSTDVTGWLK